MKQLFFTCFLDQPSYLLMILLDMFEQHTFWYIWWCMFLTFITRVVSFLYLCTCFFAYITCLYFTLDALMDLVWVFQLRQIASLSCCDLFSCKVFLEFIVLVRLMYFLCNSYGDCCFILLSWLCLWFYHRLPKREIVRVIFLVIG